jgi:hypothetical protein
MANAYIRSHNATVKFGSDGAIDNATIIGIPGNEYDLIEKPSLTDTRKAYDLSDTPDSPEIEFTVPNGATLPAVGATVTITITLTKASKTVTFSGIIVSVLPGNAEVGGLLGTTITVKPISNPVVAAT